MTQALDNNKRGFLELALRCGALRFGEFTLKSGRQSPYFFNAGLFHHGSSLARLARHYAQALASAGAPFDVLFGPAYKGIPLSAIVAVSLAQDHGIDVGVAYNRKEAKDHGEGGWLVGAPLKGRIMIIDDVISAGTSVRESVQWIRQTGAEPAGVVIALDRQERGLGERSAVQEVEQDMGLKVIAIAGLNDLTEFLADSDDYQEQFAAVNAYREQYGA